MTDRSHQVKKMRVYLSHLRYAVHTTTCNTTSAVLCQMLREAEAELARYSDVTCKQAAPSGGAEPD